MLYNYECNIVAEVLGRKDIKLSLFSFTCQICKCSSFHYSVNYKKQVKRRIYMHTYFSTVPFCYLHQVSGCICFLIQKAKQA